MSQPLAQLHVLRACTKGQEVTPHVERGVLLLEEVLGRIGVICGHIIHGEAVREGRGVCHGAWVLGPLDGAFGRGALVVSSSAKSLATVQVD